MTNINTDNIIETIEKEGIEALDLSSPDVFNTVMKLIQVGDQFSKELFGK